MSRRSAPKRYPKSVFFLGWTLAVFHPSGAPAAAVVLPTAPSGFASAPGPPDGFAGAPVGSSPVGGLSSTLLDGLTLATTVSGTYDTNVTQSPGLPIAPVEDDFIMSFGGILNYLSKSTEWTVGARYRGSFNEYFSQSQFSGYSQGGGVVANYDGGKVSVTLTAGADLDQGSNRNYSSAFVKRTNYSSGLTASYRVSRKTSLQGYFSQSFSTASGGNFDDTQAFDLGVSALWKYSPLTEFGPGLRYTYRSGSSQTGRSSIGPTINVNYKLSSKVAMTSRLGMDFASYEDGGSADPTFSASVGLNYDASKLWGMNLSLYRDTQADPALAGGFTEVTSLRLGYRRKLHRATLNLGLGYDVNRSQLPSGAAGSGTDDRKFLSVDGSLGMAILSNTTYASIFFRYGDQSSGEINSFDTFQMGFSISRSF